MPYHHEAAFLSTWLGRAFLAACVVALSAAVGGGLVLMAGAGA